jgi:hypothetical protein
MKYLLALIIGYAIGYTRQDPREYQLELTPTQIYIYQGDRLVDSTNNTELNDIITLDNE